LVTAVGNGATTITATTDGVSGSSAVTVDQAVASVEVTPASVTLVSIGETVQLIATAEDANDNAIAGETFSWASSDESIVMVSSSGLARAEANGSATITATAGGVSGTATTEVDQARAQLAIQTQPSGAHAGDPFSVQPVIEVQDANGNVVASDNTTVVTVAIESGGGTLGGTTTATTALGVATFTDLQLTGGTAGDRTLRFTATDPAPVTSDFLFLTCGPSGMVSWWPGEGDASDVIGANDGALSNGATFASGKVGQAFSFDGVDDELGSGATGIEDLQQLTVEAWVMHVSLPARVERYVTVAGGQAKAVLRHDGYFEVGQLHFYMQLNGTLQHIRADHALQAGVFHHVAGTYDGGLMRLFLDGAPVGALLVSGTVAAGEWVNFSSMDEPLDGLLDEVTIYDRALTAAEIQAIFEAGSAGKCGG
jgi:hypothetical protein